MFWHSGPLQRHWLLVRLPETTGSLYCRLLIGNAGKGATVCECASSPCHTVLELLDDGTTSTTSVHGGELKHFIKQTEPVIPSCYRREKWQVVDVDYCWKTAVKWISHCHFVPFFLMMHPCAQGFQTEPTEFWNYFKRTYTTINCLKTPFYYCWDRKP